MLSKDEIMRMAGQLGMNPSALGKDYALGWLLFGICKSPIGGKLVFKGGTSLSKVYYPNDWRLSEDLDFTLLEDLDQKSLGKILETDVPEIIRDGTSMETRFKDRPHYNKGYLQGKLQYEGPLGKDTVKIEITREETRYPFEICRVPKAYDYPDFEVQAYSKDEILAEKMRAIIQRGKIRDYYDVWRLLKKGNFEKDRIREMFLEKCRTKGVDFTGIGQFFPPDIVKTLEPYLETGLARMSREPLPPLPAIIDELKASIGFLKR